MLPILTGKILRELSLMERPTSQAGIAETVGCSRSLMAKVVGILEKKRYVHRPTRTTVAVANQQYFILYWAFRRDLEDDPCTVRETSLGTSELEESLSGASPGTAFTAYSAARLCGVYEAPYSEVYAYDLSGEATGFDPPRGRNSRLHLLHVKDEHLASRTASRGGFRVVPMRQAYVDLVSIATWEAKYAAMSLSKIDPQLPLIGSRLEMGEYL